MNKCSTIVGNRVAKAIVTGLLLNAVVVAAFLTGLLADLPAVNAATPDIIVATEQQLREAIAGAPMDDLVTSYVIQLGDNIQLTNATLVISAYKNVSLIGDFSLIGAGGQATITIENHGTLMLDGITVTHKGGDQGTGVYNGGTLNLVGSKIIGNTATIDGTTGMYSSYIYGGRVYGGGVYNVGIVNMSGGEISDNTAGIIAPSTGYSYGGGVYNTGIFNMSGNAVIANNKAMATDSYGGGIYSTGILNMSSSAVISGNTATSGNSSNSYGCGVYSAGTFNLSGNAVISNNTAMTTGYDTNYSYGVNIYNTGNFNMSSGAIVGNVTTETGVGVYNYYGTFDMSGGSISAHSLGVTNIGGTFDMSGGIISGNKGANYPYYRGGGGVDNSGVFNMSGGQISDNESMSGSGVYNTGRFTMSGTAAISANTAGPEGAVFMLIGGSFFSGSGGGGVCNYGTFEMAGGIITNNTTSRNGGGVYNITDAIFNMSAGEISANTALYGGGVCSGGIFNMTGGVISHNTARFSDGVFPSAGNGGGVFVAGIPIDGYRETIRGVFNMSGTASISSNTANDGGGVYNDYGGVFHLLGGAIGNNTASSYGGGVFNRSTLEITGGVISGNKAINGGGIYDCSGVFNYNGGDTIMLDTDRGLISSIGMQSYKNGSFNMAGATIDGNSATSNGGGIYFDTLLPINFIPSPMRISSSVITNNTAGKSGGGVWIIQPNLKDLFIDSATSPSQTVFLGNSAPNASNRSLSDNATYFSNIFSNQWSDLSVFGYLQQGYNNYDISYSTTPITYYTITFLPGEHGDFAPQVAYNLRLGDPMPKPQWYTAQPGWSFIGWEPLLSPWSSYGTVSGDATFVAQWELAYVAVTFLDWDGNELENETVYYGNDCVGPEGFVIGSTTLRPGYLFTGWDGSLDVSGCFVVSVSGEWFTTTFGLTRTAQYIPIAPDSTMFWVIFQDWDGTFLKGEFVANGAAALPPTNFSIGSTAIRTGYTFAGWDKSFANVASDIIVKALYNPQTDYSPSYVPIILGGSGFILAMLAVVGSVFVIKRRDNNKK